MKVILFSSVVISVQTTRNEQLEAGNLSRVIKMHTHDFCLSCTLEGIPCIHYKQ